MLFDQLTVISIISYGCSIIIMIFLNTRYRRYITHSHMPTEFSDIPMRRVAHVSRSMFFWIFPGLLTFVFIVIYCLESTYSPGYFTAINIILPIIFGFGHWRFLVAGVRWCEKNKKDPFGEDYG